MKVELLAPCGSYDSFLAAVNAGADAVYLAGNKFGARAYAENFDTDKLCQVIMLAHVRHVRVYLTVNTLMKEAEFEELYDFIYPLAKVGLDGIIIQDLGVFSYLKTHFVDNGFPNLELHASTQMTVTSKYGAAFLKKIGCKRIVPARELSLQEIQEIKQTVDIEIETFIHGAMCYCYSGQCLMSSFIGGRSGNRGKCAQPCRLPYSLDQKEGYYLSMKDMNTLEMLPQLIDAGITSFKIEGRMKKPEYVAHVVSIYRKYIDLYEKHPESFRIEEKDRADLQSLFIRSETSEGYYKQHNGKNMITLDKPGYNGAKEAYLNELHAKYVKEFDPIPVTVDIRCHAGHTIQGTISTKDGYMCHVEGPVIEVSQKKPASMDDMEKQMKKMGNSPFVLSEFYGDLGENCFVPVKVLNDLRRSMISDLVKVIYAISADDGPRKTNFPEKDAELPSGISENLPKQSIRLSVTISTMEQLQAVLSEKHQLNGFVILDSDLLVDEYEQLCPVFENNRGLSFGVKLPAVIRSRDAGFLEKLQSYLKEQHLPIAYACTLDGLAYLQKIGYQGLYASMPSVYTWNVSAYDFYETYFSVLSLPAELNSTEIRELCLKVKVAEKLEACLYGRQALMVSANCVKRTGNHCDHNRDEWSSLTDRMGKEFPVYTNCNHCYNILYNDVPTSLYDMAWMLKEDGVLRYRLDFTTEDKNTTKQIIQTFSELCSSENWKRKASSQESITRGHFKRGVE